MRHPPHLKKPDMSKTDGGHIKGQRCPETAASHVAPVDGPVKAALPVYRASLGCTTSEFFI
jgi:hypothetical protein